MKLNERLENWGRWARDRKRYSHCASIEHRYNSPQTWHPPEAKVLIDVRDAEFVQDMIAWALDRNLMKPNQSRALKYVFIEPGYNRWKAAAKCGVYTIKRFEILAHESKVLLCDVLELRTGVHYHTINNSSNGCSLAKPDSAPMGGPAVA